MDSDSKSRLQNITKKLNIPLIDIPPEEGIGLKAKPGSFATNCLSLPGHLLGSAKFQTSKVNEALLKNNIKHTVIPLTQFRLSGGSVHCLTNEI